MGDLRDDLEAAVKKFDVTLEMKDEQAIELVRLANKAHTSLSGIVKGIVSLYLEEKTRTPAVVKQVSEAALGAAIVAAFRKYEASQKPDAPRCSYCHRWGHRRAACPTLHPSSGPKSSD